MESLRTGMRDLVTGLLGAPFRLMRDGIALTLLGVMNARTPMQSRTASGLIMVLRRAFERRLVESNSTIIFWRAIT